jgi:hypothetical protein
LIGDPNAKPENEHHNRSASKTEFNGIGAPRIDISVVPICGTPSCCNLRPLFAPALGPFFGQRKTRRA